MEPRIVALEVRVDVLEKRSNEHEEEDERLHRYMTHMMEDLQARLAGIEKTGQRFESDLVHRNGRDQDTKTMLDEIFDRLRVLERLVWIAVGGVTVIGGVLWFGLSALLKVLR